MAYANLVSLTCADKAEFFKRLRDFICKRNGSYDYSTTGIGWILHDSSYAVDEDNPAVNDWFVISSVGESGRDTLYFQIKWVSGYIAVRGWLYWNNSTHAGVQNYYASENSFVLPDSINEPQLSIYGDLDYVFFAETAATNCYSGAFGKLQSCYETETIAHATADITAGSDVSITIDVAIPSDWKAGRGLFIWNSAGIEKTTIKTVDTGTQTITVDLTNSYSGTVKLSRFLSYIQTTTVSLTSYLLINKAGTKLYSIGAPIFSASVANYDSFDNAYWLADIIFDKIGGVHGKIKNMRSFANIAPLSHKDVLIDNDNVQWRCLVLNSSKYVAVKEV